jgi:hypothetical protein
MNESELRTLKAATALYALGTTVHTIDHFRRGLDVLTLHVQWIGWLGLVLAAFVMALVLLGHPLAPRAAAAAGFAQALGIAAVHLPPRWSAFSDSLASGHLGPMSWAAVTIEIIGALAMGLAGLGAIRQSRYAAATA